MVSTELTLTYPLMRILKTGVVTIAIHMRLLTRPFDGKQVLGYCTFVVANGNEG